MLCLFIGITVRTVHLDKVLRRFIAQRNKSDKTISDNATL